MSRRIDVLRRPLLLAAAVAGTAAVIKGAAIEPNQLRVNRVDVPVGEGGEELVGARVAHVSDLHVLGHGWRRRTIEAAIEAVNGEKVDVVAFTGDFIGQGRGVADAIEILTGLRRDVPSFGVLGNHDHVYGARYTRMLTESLTATGIQMLNNDAARIEVSRGHVWVVGVDDGYSARDDLELAMRPVGESTEPRILLTHYPEVAESLRPGQFGLSLAGHSHAGQIRIPGIGSLMHRVHARTRYGKGLFLVNGNPLFVSPGVGMSGIPMRFLNPPEVAIITFVESGPTSTAVSYQLSAVSV